MHDRMKAFSNCETFNAETLEKKKHAETVVPHAFTHLLNHTASDIKHKPLDICTRELWGFFCLLLQNTMNI